MSGEKAVFVPGEGVKLLGTDEDYFRNMDDYIAEKTGIERPEYGARARELCMDFCYFDRDLAVFSEEEGIHRAINGYLVGEFSCTTRR